MILKPFITQNTQSFNVLITNFPKQSPPSNRQITDKLKRQTQPTKIPRIFSNYAKRTPNFPRHRVHRPQRDPRCLPQTVSRPLPIKLSLSPFPFFLSPSVSPILATVPIHPFPSCSCALRRSCARTSLRASSCTEEVSSTKEDCQDPDQFTGIPQSVRYTCPTLDPVHSIHVRPRTRALPPFSFSSDRDDGPIFTFEEQRDPLETHHWDMRNFFFFFFFFFGDNVAGLRQIHSRRKRKSKSSEDSREFSNVAWEYSCSLTRVVKKIYQFSRRERDCWQ